MHCGSPRCQTREAKAPIPRCDAAHGASRDRIDVSKTIWPSGLRRRLKAPYRKGVGSSPDGGHCSLPGAKVVCAASLTAGQSQEFAATAPTRALGRQRIWTRETAPARVAASALPRGLHAVAEIERARAALRTRARRLLAQAARTERRSTCLLAEINGNNGIMVECISATEMTRTRFPADALSLSLSLLPRAGLAFVVAACQGQREGSAIPALERQAAQDASTCGFSGNLTGGVSRQKGNSCL